MSFTKQKDFLVCVDSDGCAMDTMDIKHIRCFGPCMVREWELQTWEEPILTRWNEINLYTMTRGINRFEGLSLALQEIHKKYCCIDGLEALVTWVSKSDELSNNALAAVLAESPSVCLKKALAWSNAVNAAIACLPQEMLHPFALAKEALAYAHQIADIAIVSSANRAAVMAEWGQHGLLDHVDVIMAQDSGSKASCIAQLLDSGYALEHVLMCGDAPGDLRAARKNGVFFYPILVRRENESWREFMESGLDHLIHGRYAAYEREKIGAFRENLGENK